MIVYPRMLERSLTCVYKNQNSNLKSVALRRF
jgi:hypothetical protein